MEENPFEAIASISEATAPASLQAPLDVYGLYVIHHWLPEDLGGEAEEDDSCLGLDTATFGAAAGFGAWYGAGLGCAGGGAGAW